MSRTTRFHYKYGLLRDRARKAVYVSNSCARHGRCSWCLGNRTHKHQRARSIVEYDTSILLRKDIPSDFDWEKSESY